MTEELELVLRLVAEGRLSPEEAEPLIAALGSRAGAREDISRQSPPLPPEPPRPTLPPTPRQLRLRITEGGRQVVSVGVPYSIARLARALPGLTDTQAESVRAAMEAGVVGPIFEVEDEEGDGVFIGIE